MKFIADAMLGKLAKWMRVLGYDVEYFSRISDEELIERAEESGRMILTRDTLLSKRRKVRGNHFFIRGDHYRDQLRQVLGRFPLTTQTGIFSRCLVCNEPLQPVDREEAHEKVPPYVYETQDEFETCPSCGRIYWSATHVEEMEKQLRKMGLCG
ncbi:MAG: Mut7-C RNAse domain-containing protein [bacterium]